MQGTGAMAMETSYGRDQLISDVLDLAHLAEIGSFVERSPASRPSAPPQAETPAARAESHPAEAEGVDSLLVKASKAIEILATRCEILEHDLAEANARADEHEQTGDRWKSIAVELRSQLAFQRKQLDELKGRSELAEARVLVLEAGAVDAQDRMAAADARSTKLQGQVLAAFGRKSPIYSLLQSITLQDAAE